MARRILGLVALLAITGCGGKSNKVPNDPDMYKKEIISTEEERSKAYAGSGVGAHFYKKAYEHGVRDTMNEYKSRMRARSEFVFEPTVIDRVCLPGRVIGGTYYPAHCEPVIVKPGRWVMDGGVSTPDDLSGTAK